MLCFLFAALIVALDQFFKHWILRTLELGERGPELIPGILRLTRWENDGAMLNILSGQQWLLAGIAFVAAVVLIMILLRYNEGFWGTLGLAAVLGGTVGNLIDRVFNDGRVVDMFETMFISFPIFNIADIFITLGFITFLIHFITLTVKGDKNEPVTVDTVTKDSPEASGEVVYDEFPDIGTLDSAHAEDVAPPPTQYPETQYSPDAQSSPIPQYPESQYSPDAQSSSIPQYPETQYSPDAQSSPIPQYPETQPVDLMTSDYEPITDTTDTSFSLDSLDAELESLNDYSVDDLLREYGFEEESE